MMKREGWCVKRGCCYSIPGDVVGPGYSGGGCHGEGACDEADITRLAGPQQEPVRSEAYGLSVVVGRPMVDAQIDQ